MVASTTLPLSYPIGTTLQSLSLSIRQIVDVLRTLQTDIDQSAAIDALNSSVTTLESDVSDLDALIAAGDAMTAQQKFELGLVTRADEILGSFTNIRAREQTSREQAADAAIAALINANSNTTGLKQEVRVRVEENLAFAETLDSLTADLASTNANITTLSQTVADGDQALATQITDVSSTVAGNVASIQVLAASVNGHATRFAVTINSQNEVTGFIRLDGTEAGTTFTVNVDGFYVGKAGTSGGTAIPVFAIQTVDGAAKVAIRGDLIADGVISAAKIAAGSVTAAKINVSSLTAISAAFGDATVTGVLTGGATGKLKLDFTSGRIRGIA